ncbi:MAG: copper chaperone PCu(A)C [Betaproteobacteria bacterium]|nr:copper chaperone PCu(A)C [Betaproteobacteria bacterium]
MSIFRLSCAVLTAVSISLPVAAQKNAAAAAAVPVVTDAWVKTMVPGATVSGAYMHIKSAQPVKLVKAESPVAGLVELHNMSMKDGVMEMKAMDAVDVPANKIVDLKPGGMHVMLMMVKKPIGKGDKVPLTLTFEGADKKPLVVKVEAVAQEKDSGLHKH